LLLSTVVPAEAPNNAGGPVFDGGNHGAGHGIEALDEGPNPNPGGGNGWNGITYDAGGVQEAAATDVIIVTPGGNVAADPLPKPSSDPLTPCHEHCDDPAFKHSPSWSGAIVAKHWIEPEAHGTQPIAHTN